MIDIDITISDIRNNFDKRTIYRGKNYYKDNRVVEMNSFITTDKKRLTPKVTIFSKVNGTRLYKQKIVLPTEYDNMIDGECSCPVGYNCKHVVAVLFKLLEDNKSNNNILSLEDNKSNNREKKDIEAQNWINKFTTISNEQLKIKNIIKNNEKEISLIYRLFESRSYDDSELEFYRSIKLKNGKLSKGAFLHRDNLFNNYEYESYLDNLDKDIIASVLNLTTGYSKSIKFMDEYGAIVLKKIVDTNRCFFMSYTKPLRFIEETKKLSFSWQKMRNKSKLISNLDSNEFLITETIPPLCINKEDSLIYEVKSSYTKELLTFMLNAPELSSSSLITVSQKILEKFPNIEFPIPEGFKIEELKTNPKPYLYIYGQKNQNNKTIHAMKLSFRYDEYKIDSENRLKTIIFTENNKNIKVIRNIELENSYKDTIKSFGFKFEPHRDILAYLSFADPSMQVAIERWRVFITKGVPILKDEGWDILIDDNFNYEFEYIDTITVESNEAGDTNQWFELSFSVDIGGRSVALMPIVASLLEEFNSIDELPEKLNLEIEEGKFLHIESKDIKPILKTIFELFDKKVGDNLVINPFDAHLLDFDSQADIIWKGTKELKELSNKLKNFKGIEDTKPSPNLNANLREYQQLGLNWLNFLHEFKFSGILADDMGLGKTVQSLAFLQLLKYREELTKPILIIMPTSLIGNWKNEIRKFTPDLTFLELYGIDRANKFKDISKYDLILTTYQLSQRDEEKYKKIDFLYIILDEAQKIKNPKTKMAVAIKSFKSNYKLALSGTPIENHLGELWSIFDFLMNGFLDNLKVFKSLYQNPIEKEHDLKRRELLNRKISPFILRRTKEEVVTELPPKTEIIKKAQFDKKQAKLYENIRVTMEKKVQDTIRNKGLSRSHITILDALLKLRQICCHPQLLKLDSAKSVKESAKLNMFLELIDDLNLNGKKVLVFSQFTSMLSIIESEIKKRKITYSKLTGSTRKREEAIEKFTKGDATIFLISLRAGGIGLNLVEADTVIHYDPWWNPAVENQATDRAYRIGQDKAVFVYKLIVENSIEENIIKLQEKKKSLQSSIYHGNEDKDNKFDGKELLSLLRS